MQRTILLAILAIVAATTASVAALFLTGSRAGAPGFHGTDLGPGFEAPDFTLQSTTGEKIRLSHFRWKSLVLLEFYVADFAATWSRNLSARMVDHQKFHNLGIQVLGISANDTFSQKTFGDSLKLPFPLLSDFPDSKVIRSYGVLRSHPEDPDLKAAQRAFFLIDKRGTVRGRWIVSDDVIFPSESILQAARELSAKFWEKFAPKEPLVWARHSPVACDWVICQ
jgi:thioredoxin-dependent peroxiredoxin